MSLKARIEAVIYASEEPVTLTQLVGLLGEEAQAELDRFTVEQLEAQQALALSDNAEESAALTGTAEPIQEQSTAPAGGWPESAEAEAAKAERRRAQKLRAFFRGELDRLIADYAAPDSGRGIEIREIAGGFRFSTKPEYHDAVRGFVKSLKPPLKLTLPALETLSVIAYKQPVTAPEISEIRGVDTAGVLGSLITRKLITTAGRKQVIGRPILYKTTKEFLLKFGLKDISELPSIEEFEKVAGQFAEQEEFSMRTDESSPDPEAQRSPSEPYAPRTADEGAAKNVCGETGDLASIDGRISSLPPNYAAEDLADDPSAHEAAIQRDEGVE